jgi:hypothetical protein
VAGAFGSYRDSHLQPRLRRFGLLVFAAAYGSAPSMVN